MEIKPPATVNLKKTLKHKILTKNPRAYLTQSTHPSEIVQNLKPSPI